MLLTVTAGRAGALDAKGAGVDSTAIGALAAIDALTATAALDTTGKGGVDAAVADGPVGAASICNAGSVGASGAGVDGEHPTTRARDAQSDQGNKRDMRWVYRRAGAMGKRSVDPKGATDSSGAGGQRLRRPTPPAANASGGQRPRRPTRPAANASSGG
jgi:hypothetical protein